MAEDLCKALEDCGLRPELKHFQLRNSEKATCYNILKCLLSNLCSLQESEWDEKRVLYSERTCRLVYGKKTCKISVLDKRGIVERSGEVATLDIYLRWSGKVRPVASLSNVQRAQNELRFLGVHSAKLDTCFSLARCELLREPSYSRRDNLKLKIICEDIILPFCSGKGLNEVTVLYDDQKSTAVSHIAVWENNKHTFEIRSA